MCRPHINMSASGDASPIHIQQLWTQESNVVEKAGYRKAVVEEEQGPALKKVFFLCTPKLR